ncbi:MAG: MPBQ/MSBQ methyltransferase [Natronomonas sp.]|jgi:MPBQ/MSBQ methyltransferase
MTDRTADGVGATGSGPGGDDDPSTAEPLHRRVRDHFTDDGDRDDLWAGFARFLDTRAYLNLGYSRWYQPHPIGDSQRRLADRVGRDLAAALIRTEGVRLLDAGCGRGGPVTHLAAEFGFDVTGVDLVPYNVEQARANGRERDVDAAFVLGDATALPLGSGVFPVAVALDSLVYVPDEAAAFAELSRVLAPDGHLVVTDLVARDGIGADGHRALEAFADAWDMPVPSTLSSYRAAVDGAGFAVRTVADLSRNSTGRFRKWSGLYLALASGPTDGTFGWLHRRLGLDPDVVRRQVRTAHEALPSLRRVLLHARRD